MGQGPEGGSVKLWDFTGGMAGMWALAIFVAWLIGPPL